MRPHILRVDHQNQIMVGYGGKQAKPAICITSGRWTPIDYDNEVRNQQLKANEQELLNEKEKKVRIAVCLFAILGMTVCQMSRMNLNVSIVEMVLNSNSNSDNQSNLDFDDGSCPIYDVHVEIADAIQSSSVQFSVSQPHDNSTIYTNSLSQSDPVRCFNEEAGCHRSSASNEDATTTQDGSITGSEDASELIIDEAPTIPEQTAYPKFNWSVKQQNLLLGAFYIGYAPLMISGGIMAEKYGNKYLILLSVAGSSIVNLLTPFLASSSFELLVVSRILMGAMQSAIFPSLYDLFSKWLTMTETSIFAPMIKVAYSIGVVTGSLLPGVIIGNGFGWPLVFYVSGSVCFIWSVIWYIISDSAPQQSRFVRQPELNRIMRKKNPDPSIISTISNQQHRYNSNNNFTAATGCNNCQQFNDESQASVNSQNRTKSASKSKEGTPWKLILTSPSVLSLILVKFTYQFCLDFATIELASYLKNVFHAPVKLISAITVIMFAIHTVFMVFVGILAKNMVRNKTFGWSKTTTRKVFQGIANFTMAIMYVLVSLSNCNVTLVAILLQVIAFVWMFGAGGETMLPYDLSEKFPATIVGIAHSACGVSGIVMTLVTSQILGDRGNDNARWNLLLRLVAGSSFVGGLVFTLVAKAEPIENKQQHHQHSAKIETQTDAISFTGAGCKKRGSVEERTKVYFNPNSSPPDVVINLKGVGSHK